MNSVARFFHALGDFAAGWRAAPSFDFGTGSENLRARPNQAQESDQWMYAPGHVEPQTMAEFAASTWVYTAISRLAEMAMSTPLHVFNKHEPSDFRDDHPLLDLIGQYGTPNDAQTAVEFWEQHFTMLDAAGNAYWYLSSVRGGAPDEIYLLDPTKIKVKPGRTRTIGAFEYNPNGVPILLMPEQIIHHKKPSPYSVYYGLSALDVLRAETQSDRHMRRWNSEYFKTGAPSGILVVPPSVPAKERRRIQDEMNSEHSQKRSFAVVASEPGATVWLDAALKHHDLDFKDGRMLSRQLIFDALGLHTGLLSEASTEAHARVAERMVRNVVWNRHYRTASAATPILKFYSASRDLVLGFEDVRAQDWQQESLKLKAVQPYMTVDEVRARYLKLPPMPASERRLKQAEGRLGQQSEAPGDDEQEMENVQ